MLTTFFFSYFGLKIITLVRTTLTDLKLAIEGTIIMSERLKTSLDSMYDAR